MYALRRGMGLAAGAAGLLFLLVFSKKIIAQPELEHWRINTDGATGRYYSGGNLVDNGIECDVQEVLYSSANVYVRATGVPRYPTAPFSDGNPSQAQNQDYLFRIPRQPEVGPSGGTATGLGHTGVLVNGVVIFNPLDAFSYNNQNVWHQNGGFFELDGFDCAGGHPAMGQYHHHLVPAPFSDAPDPASDVCTGFPSEGLIALDPTVHSPLIGFAFDGYPIYGPFGFSAADGTGGIARIRSSYRTRDITVRHTLANGTALPPNQWGPDVGAFITPAIPPGAAPIAADLGAYAEDFEFIAGLGDLDVHNGRFCVTPDYPNGTYAYFATVDSLLHPAFPYFLASYRGVVATDNFGGPPGSGNSTGVTISEAVETYTGSSSAEVPGGTGGRPCGAGPAPNPATDGFTWAGLPLDGAQRLDFYDMGGRLIRAGSPADGCDTSGLSRGTYLVRWANQPGCPPVRLVLVRP